MDLAQELRQNKSKKGVNVEKLTVLRNTANAIIQEIFADFFVDVKIALIILRKNKKKNKLMSE